MDSDMISIEKPKLYCSNKNTQFKVNKKYLCNHDKIQENITEKQTENPDYINTLSKRTHTQIFLQ